MTPAELDLTDCDFPCACDRHRRPAPAQTPDQPQPAAGPAITFAGCARCGGAHADLPTERLIRPFAPTELTAQVWSHWALCPATAQPILIAMADDPRHVERGTASPAEDA